GGGEKKVAIVWKELGVESLEALKQAIASGAAAKLKGFGEKSVAQIMAGMEFAAKATERTPLGVAWPLAQAVVEQVRALPGVKRVEIAGSLRRALETIGDIDILCEAKDGRPVIDAFTTLPGVARVLAAGDTKGSVLVERPGGANVQVDLRVVPTESFGAAFQYFTGSKEHNVRLRDMAIRRNCNLNA